MQKIANIQAQRSELSSQQQQDIQRFEVVQSYFNVQLQQQLVASSLFNFNAMQKHYSNALKLEQQGFISKGNVCSLKLLVTMPNELYKMRRQI